MSKREERAEEIADYLGIWMADGEEDFCKIADYIIEREEAVRVEMARRLIEVYNRNESGFDYVTKVYESGGKHE